MKFEALDIPMGLEDAYYGAVQLVTNFFGTALRAHKPALDKRRYKKFVSQSLMRVLRSSYGELSPNYKKTWRDYGAPYSLLGYSAFIEFNAPLISAKQPLVLVAPLYTGNVVKNYAMFGNPPKYWTLGDAGLFLGNGHASVIADNYTSDTLICEQTVVLMPDTDYEIGFNFWPYDYEFGQIKFGLNTDLFTFNLSDFDPENRRITHTFHTSSGSGFFEIQLKFFARGNIQTSYIAKVSCVEV